MGKLQSQICRICRTEKNLKYTAKELRQFNKKQLLSAQGSQEGQGTARASKKLLLTTRTLGNICLVCDERIQIYHHLDDGEHASGSDIEIDVIDTTNTTLATRLVNNFPNCVAPTQRQRPDTPVIVDDDDMLYNLFMEKVDQQRQFKTNSHHPHEQVPLPHQYPLQLQQQQQFVTQFQSPYTPPQSMAGGSEGDETKVIEVLTSRESTPASSIHLPGSNPIIDMVDQQGHRIVAIIDLDDGEDNDTKTNDVILRTSTEKEVGRLTPLTNSSCELSVIDTSEERTPIVETTLSRTTQHNVLPEYDDEEIVFRKVEEQKSTPPSSGKKRNRKSYDEKQLRLVASLSLLSSDSENEDSTTKSINKKPLYSSSPATETVVMQKRFHCTICNINFTDAESLSVHDRIHQGVKCPVCQFGFPQIQRLIHHMRYKHREYNGEVLSEKPRIGQDSCMTIRLRYLQRTTFYECQLCGRIDEIFREHKEHIIDKHSIESKSLKDPMMKQLKCPLCKENCGALYLSLCRHLIEAHEHTEYRGHLRELLHVSAFGWNAARQRQVAKTARIYQFIKRKTFFFQCKICHKVEAGYLHHLKHLKKHETPRKEKTKATSNTSATTTDTDTDTDTATTINSSTTPVKTIVLKKTQKKVESVNVKSKLKKTKGNSIEKLQISINSKKSHILKKTIEKPETKSKTKYLQKKPIETMQRLSRKSTETVKNVSKKSTESSTKLKIKINLKPKDKGKLPIITKAPRGRPKKDKEILPKNVIKKIKKKSPIRQIDLQKYKCNHCLKKFKGFRLFNLHLLKQHKENEFHPCTKCNEIFATPLLTKQHLKECNLNTLGTKQKRKYVELCTKQDAKVTKIDVPEKVPQIGIPIHTSNCTEEEDRPQWLKDLLKLNVSSETRDSISVISSMHATKTNTALFIPQNINLQCCYCLHLFTCRYELTEHTKQQHSQKQPILIKYKPING